MIVSPASSFCYSSTVNLLVNRLVLRVHPSFVLFTSQAFVSLERLLNELDVALDLLELCNEELHTIFKCR